MKAELQQLVSLQNLDISIRRLQAEIEAIPLRRAEIEKEFDQRASEIRALETKRDDARHERARVEKEISDQRADRSAADGAVPDDPWPIGGGPIHRCHGPGRYSLQTRFVTGKEIHRRVDERRRGAL